MESEKFNMIFRIVLLTAASVVAVAGSINFLFGNILASSAMFFLTSFFLGLGVIYGELQ